jgi:hypothetical protein
MKSGTGASSIVLEALPGSLAMPADFASVPDPASRKEQAVLRQRQGLFAPWRQMVLFSEHYLEFSDSSGRRPRILNLAFLAAEPATISAIAWRWLCVGLVALTAVVITLYLAEWLHAVWLSLLSAACFSICLTKSQRRLLFRTKYGGLVVFEVFFGVWQRRQAGQFVELVKQRIATSSSILPKGEQRLAVEVAEHRRMLDEGWLSRARYEQAKKRIFRHYKRPKSAS